MLSNKN